jgi:Holliday junction resolvase RusA-like endonuclease
MAKSILKLTLHGDIVPKLRPRVTSRGTYMPDHYTDWKRRAIDYWGMQKKDYAIDIPVHVDILMVGKHSRGKDLDNTAGAILDALVEGNFLKKDNMMVVAKLAISLEYTKKELPFTWIELISI